MHSFDRCVSSAGVALAASVVPDRVDWPASRFVDVRPAAGLCNGAPELECWTITFGPVEISGGGGHGMETKKLSEALSAWWNVSLGHDHPELFSGNELKTC